MNNPEIPAPVPKSTRRNRTNKKLVLSKKWLSCYYRSFSATCRSNASCGVWHCVSYAKAIPRRTLSSSPLIVLNLDKVVSKLVILRSPALDWVKVIVTTVEGGEGTDEDRVTPRELSKEQSFQPVLDIIPPMLAEASAFAYATKDEAAGGTRATSEDGSGE